MLTPWMDILGLPVVVISIHLLRTNLSASPLLALLNFLSAISASLIQLCYNLFHFTKEPRSNSLIKKRQAPLVSLYNISTLVVTYYLALVYSSSPLPPSQAVTFSFLQFLTSLITISSPLLI